MAYVVGAGAKQERHDDPSHPEPADEGTLCHVVDGETADGRKQDQSKDGSSGTSTESSGEPSTTKGNGNDDGQKQEKQSGSGLRGAHEDAGRASRRATNENAEERLRPRQFSFPAIEHRSFQVSSSVTLLSAI